MAQYNQTLLDAVREVADVVANWRALERETAQQEEALDDAQRSYDLTSERYRAGLDNYLSVLSSQNQVLLAQGLKAELQARRLNFSVELVRALGGGYTAPAHAGLRTGNEHSGYRSGNHPGDHHAASCKAVHAAASPPVANTGRGRLGCRSRCWCSLWWLFYARYYESTDDAYVSGDLVNVMSQVSGTVVSIGADETDRVNAGQELVRLDATDYRIALDDAEQQLARTVRQTHTVFANRDQLQAVVGQRRADFAKAQADFDRRKNLTKSGAVSGEELSHAQDALNAARDALTAAQKNLAASVALVGRTGVADNPDVQAAATQVERAWLNVSRTSVRAPVTGYVARRSVQLGERIAPGQPHDVHRAAGAGAGSMPTSRKCS